MVGQQRPLLELRKDTETNRAAVPSLSWEKVVSETVAPSTEPALIKYVHSAYSGKWVSSEEKLIVTKIDKRISKKTIFNTEIKGNTSKEKTDVIEEMSDCRMMLNESLLDLDQKTKKKKKILAKVKNFEKSKSKAMKATKKKVDQAEMVCVFHLAGRCKKGSSCPFSHAKSDHYKKPICKQFRSWFNCRWGKDCMYLHEGNPTEDMKVPVFIPVEQKERVKKNDAEVSLDLQSKIRKVCPDFQKGNCKRGAKCWFMHLYTGVFKGKEDIACSRTQPYPATKQVWLPAQALPYNSNSNYQEIKQAEAITSAHTQGQVLPITAEQQVSAPPPGWSVNYDSNYRCCYYYNRYTNKSQWVLPTFPAQPMSKAASIQQLAAYQHTAAVRKPLLLPVKQSFVQVLVQQNQMEIGQTSAHGALFTTGSN